MRRIVTGHTPDGKATFVSDTELEAVDVGWGFFKIWGADRALVFPDDGSPPPYSTYFPPVGGFRFVISTLPPEPAEPLKKKDHDELLEKLEENMPGAVKYMEKDNPGMHTTDTIDFGYIISGEIWLELDDGKEVHLKAGDSVIQNGTRHSWHNRSSEPCLMLFCLIGAHRK
jgi:mannose-6-phosphate isomerase-like protein (cupin superfamily)